MVIGGWAVVERGRVFHPVYVVITNLGNRKMLTRINASTTLRIFNLKKHDY